MDGVNVVFVSLLVYKTIGSRSHYTPSRWTTGTGMDHL